MQTKTKIRKGFKYAGPTAAGTYVQRKTDNDYAYAVAVIDRTERVYKPKHPEAVNGYVPNPTLGEWVGVSWSSRYDLAAKQADKLRSFGHRSVAILPVVDPATIVAEEEALAAAAEAAPRIEEVATEIAAETTARRAAAKTSSASAEKTTGLSESPAEPTGTSPAGTPNRKEPTVASSKKAAPAASETSAPVEEKAPEMHDRIVAAVAERGIALVAKWSPTGAYASYRVEGGPTLAYVQKETKKGSVRVEVRIEPGKLPKSIKGFGANYMGNKATFGYLGHFDAKGVPSVAAAIALAYERDDAAKVAKAEAAKAAAEAKKEAAAAKKAAAAEKKAAAAAAKKAEAAPAAPPAEETPAKSTVHAVADPTPIPKKRAARKAGPAKLAAVVDPKQGA